VKRRTFIRAAITAVALASLPRALYAESNMQEAGVIGKLVKTDDQWRRILTPAQFEVLRNEGTEPAFSSPLNKEYGEGVYVCAACALPLFESRTKFDSGTGWPSFYAPIAGHVETRRDFKLIWPRTEYHCARCGGHQGHVFNDGPAPTGQRWCNNGVALRFIPS